jgi:ubiquinone/menaquinone biosynthesis C-methylase UbiE
MQQTSLINLEKWRQISKEHFSRITPRYDQGRDFEEKQRWIADITSRVSIERRDWVLDAGCGTGLLAAQFAGQMDGRVLGLDPARAMLNQALQKPQRSNLSWAQGISESLPLAVETIKAVFLSQVWHHLADQEQAASEFFRCLKPGGGLFIKTFSHEQLRARWDLQFIFPELMPLMLGIYPDVTDFEQLLKGIGFSSVEFQSAQRENSLLPSQLLTFLREKAWSMFSFLSSQGSAEGQARLEALVAAGDVPVSFPDFQLLVIALK